MLSLQKAKDIIKIFKGQEKVLPITVSNNVRCLDFDMDNVVFKPIAKIPIQIREKKDAMEMV
jgi:hypothetical protein